MTRESGDHEFVRVRCPGCSRPVAVERAVSRGNTVYHARCGTLFLCPNADGPDGPDGVARDPEDHLDPGVEGQTAPLENLWAAPPGGEAEPGVSTGDAPGRPSDFASAAPREVIVDRQPVAGFRKFYQRDDSDSINASVRASHDSHQAEIRSLRVAQETPWDSGQTGTSAIDGVCEFVRARALALAAITILAAAVVSVGVVSFRAADPGRPAGDVGGATVYREERQAWEARARARNVLIRQAEEFAEQYADIENWEDRVPYVKDAAAASERMRRYYDRSPFRFQPLRRLATGSFAAQPDERYGDQRPMVILTAAFADYSGGAFVVVQTADGLKMDWDAMVGYNAVTLSNFIATGAAGPVVFRVRVEVSDYFGSGFSPDRHACWKLSHPDELAVLHAYKGLDTGVKVEMDEILGQPGKADSQSQPLTVVVRHSEASTDPGLVELVQIQCRGWVWQ